MRHPSLRRAAGQGPVLVGTIGSLWPSWVLVGVGDGAAGLRDARQRDDPGQRGYQGLSWGAWTWIKDGITRGRYRAAAAAAKPPGGIRGPEAPGVTITSGAPTHRASPLGPQGDSEAVFLVSK